jgi:hypothetical protein
VIAKTVAVGKPEEKFVEKRQWMIPRQHFVLVKLSEKKLRKLAKWLKNRDNVAIHILGSSGELFLLNESIIDRRRKRKHV